MLQLAIPLLATATAGLAAVTWNETTAAVTLKSDRIALLVDKAKGYTTKIAFDGIDLLGTGNYYFDCFCIPGVATSNVTAANPNPQQSRNYRAGSSGKADFELYHGAQNEWVGLSMTETYASSGQIFQQFWFIREGEQGIHTFSRHAFPDTDPSNPEIVNLGNLQEFRQVITPKSPIWTHLMTNELQYAHLPTAAAIAQQKVVQDATWVYNVTGEQNPYFEEAGPYFTKYQFADAYGDHKAHGLWADGSAAALNGTSVGLWTVFNNLEGYTGGPLRSDLVVDTNIYNYYASNHHGSATMNITTGFDRTFGPSIIYMNKGGDIHRMYKEAAALADPLYAADFYDEIAHLIPGFASAAERATASFKISMPEGATNGRAVLSQPGVDFQDAIDPKVLQYWGNVSSDGTATIPRVKAGEYRLTVYADGIFGEHVEDGIQIKAGGKKDKSIKVKWKAESHGAELWRIGSPDKSAGEFRHGYAKDPTLTNHQEEYRSYWGRWDFPTDFPNGVNYTIGISDPAKDWNYVHFSRYGGSYTRPDFVLDNVNEWTVNWAPKKKLRKDGKEATLTVQLAGVHTPSGNLDLREPTADYGSDLPFTVKVNDNPPLNWTIPYDSSSSCVERSGIACYNIRNLFTFPGSWLNDGDNKFVFALPFNYSGGDVNFRQYSTNVLYDAIRLELSK